MLSLFFIVDHELKVTIYTEWHYFLLLSALLIKLEGGGDGGEVLDGDHLLLCHCLELSNGIIHDGGKLRPERSDMARDAAARRSSKAQDQARGA